MDIEELREARIELEDKLLSLIAAEINIFKRKTKFSPISIYINIIKIEVFGEDKPDYVLNKVSVELEKI